MKKDYLNCVATYKTNYSGTNIHLIFPHLNTTGWLTLERQVLYRRYIAKAVTLNNEGNK